MAVYFIQSPNGGPIKIGTTKQLKTRLWSLSKEAGERLRVLAVMEGHCPEERLIHRCFAHLRVSGEWFTPAVELLAFIEAEGKPWDGKDDAPTVALKVWLDLGVGEDCLHVARWRGISVSEYISEAIREIASHDARVEGRLVWKRHMESQGLTPSGDPLNRP
jgi:hypothetical protein